MVRILLLISATLFMACSAIAEPIGTLDTIDGHRYFISQLGTPDNPKNYFINTRQRYIPINEVNEIARINVSHGKIAYLVRLNNGELKDGRQGLFFYDSVEFTEPKSGTIKTGYVPVMKERENDGFMFVAYNPDNGNEYIVEIVNPDDISTITFWKNGVNHRQIKKNTPQQREKKTRISLQYQS